MWRRLPALGVFVALLALLPASCGGDNNELILGATTSVQDPGLLDEIVHAFEGVTDYHVKPSIGGSGEGLEKARRGGLAGIKNPSPAGGNKFFYQRAGLGKTPPL